MFCFAHAPGRTCCSPHPPGLRLTDLYKLAYIHSPPSPPGSPLHRLGCYHGYCGPIPSPASWIEPAAAGQRLSFATRLPAVRCYLRQQHHLAVSVQRRPELLVPIHSPHHGVPSCQFRARRCCPSPSGAFRSGCGCNWVTLPSSFSPAVHFVQCSFPATRCLHPPALCST